MALSNRNRAKGAAAAQKLVPQAHVSDYVVGRAGQNPLTVTLSMIGCFVGCLVLTTLIFGTPVILGIIPMLAILHAISPPRGLLIASEGIAVTQRSFWTGKPHKLLTVMGHGYVQPHEVSMGRVKVGVGHEAVWLSQAEEARLRAALGLHIAPALTTPVVPNPYG